LKPQVFEDGKIVARRNSGCFDPFRPPRGESVASGGARETESSRRDPAAESSPGLAARGRADGADARGDGR